MKQRGRTGWRRWVVRGAVCVVLGVVTTVGVAWGLAASSFYDAQYFMGRQAVEGQDFDLEVCAGIGRVRRLSFYIPPEVICVHRISTMSGYGGDSVDSISKLHHASEAWSKRLPSHASEERLYEASGWPRLALWCGYRPSRTSGFATNVSGGVPLKNEMLGPFRIPLGRALPLRPVWSGMAIDTLLYSMMWATILFAWRIPVSARRGRRGKQGRCKLCGYDLVHKFDDGCPECGWNRR